MKLIGFKGQNVIIAEHQPEYIPMPAYVDPNGEVVCCWQLSVKERIKLLFTGVIWHSILTCNTNLQPQLLRLERPIFP